MLYKKLMKILKEISFYQGQERPQQFPGAFYKGFK